MIHTLKLISLQSQTEQMADTLQAVGCQPGTAVCLAITDPGLSAHLMALLPSLYPTAPVEPYCGATPARQLLTRVRPKVLLTDQPGCDVANAADEIGVPVSVANADGFGPPWATSQTECAHYAPDTALLLQTSGTTGAPKLVGLSRGNVAASVTGITQALDLGPEDRTATLMPLSHIHGIIAVLSAGLQSGGTVIPITPRDPSAFWQQVAQIAPTWLSMVPTLLHALLETAPAERPAALDQLRFLRTSSAALPAALRARAEAYFGVPVIEAYGMTEAAHQMASGRPGALTPGSVGQASPGAALAIMTPEGQPTASGATGEVCVKGPNVMHGYLWPTEANAEAFHGEWFRTGDLGRLDDKGQLWLTGRIKEQINRGGETLSPSDIEDVLLTHPAISEAVVFPHPHPTLGEEVAALCVPKADARPSTAEIIAYAAQHLPFAQTPKTVHLTDSLPNQASGKVSRTAIAKQYAQPVATPTPPASQSAEAIRMRGFVAQVLGREDFDDQASLFALGADSLSLMQLLLLIERSEGVSLPLESLLTHQTPAALMSEVARRDPSTSPTDTDRRDHGFAASAHITGLRVAERLTPHPRRNRTLIAMTVRPDFSAPNIAQAWAEVCRTQPALGLDLSYDTDGTVHAVPDPNSPRDLQTFQVCADRQSLLRDPLGEVSVAQALTVQSSLVRAICVQASGGAKVLLCDMHEALADGFGQALLPRLIEAALLGKSLPPAQPLQALMGSLPGPTADLTNLPGRLHQDAEGPRLKAVRRVTQNLDPELWEGLEHFAQAQSVTSFSVAASLFAGLIQDLAGAPTAIWTAGQRRKGAADYTTLCNATRLVRLDPISGAQTDPDQLGQTARQTMNRLFDSLSTSSEERPKADDPLYLFEVANEAQTLQALHPQLTLGTALTATAFIKSAAPQAALELALVPPTKNTSPKLTVSCDTGCFSTERMRSLLAAYRDRLAALAPGRADTTPPRHHQLAPHPATDDPTVLGALADTPRDMTALFEAIMTRWPEREAARWDGGAIRFAELDAAARSLATLLQDQGLTGEDVLAFRMATDTPARNRVLYLAAQIAAFRLKIPLMPLGQQLPTARAQAQIQAVGARFILFGTEDLDCVAPNDDSSLSLPITGFDGAMLCCRAKRYEKTVTLPPDTALIFTSSGSTGTPKTILDSQAMILGLLEGQIRTGQFPPMPSLMGPNIGFDVSIFDVWIPWVSGNPAILLNVTRRTPDALHQAAQLGARMLSLTPTVAAAALRDDPDCLRPYAILNLTGEVFPNALAANLRKQAPSLTVLNHYGPTETAIWATFWTMHDLPETSIPLGLSLPGYDVVIADPQTQAPLPPHWPGEVLIRCAAPIQGYLNPAMTAQTQVELPDFPGARFFRTGDLAWIDGTGNLRLIGRMDRQTKVSGVRIELDEVEHIMTALDSVAEAAVLVTRRTGSDMIEAVIQPANPNADPEALRDEVLAECRKWLMSAAVPRTVTFVKTMPMGVSGKKSHTVLLKILEDTKTTADGAERDDGGPPAPGSTEAELATLWQDILQTDGGTRPKVHRHTHLLTLGATSLDLIRMCLRIEQSFGQHIAEEFLMLRPTISQQAALLATPAAPALCKTKPYLEVVREGTAPEKPVIIALPSITGATQFLGTLGHHVFTDNTLIRADAPPSDDGVYTPNTLARLLPPLLDQLQDHLSTGNTLLCGFSFGGWFAWICDRALKARGHQGAPILNLDGGVFHATREEWSEIAATWADPAPDQPATQMLLCHRAVQPRFQLGHAPLTEWRGTASVNLRTTSVPTANHFDLVAPEILSALVPTVQEFAQDPSAPVQTLQTGAFSQTIGCALHALLTAPQPPTPGQVKELLNLAPMPLGLTIRVPFMALSLACGDLRLATDVAQGQVDADPKYRIAARILVELLLAQDRQAEAAARIKDWHAHSPPSVLMRTAGQIDNSTRFSWQADTPVALHSLAGMLSLCTDAILTHQAKHQAHATLSPADHT